MRGKTIDIYLPQNFARAPSFCHMYKGKYFALNKIWADDTHLALIQFSHWIHIY